MSPAALARGGAVHRGLGAHPYRLFSAGRAALSKYGPIVVYSITRGLAPLIAAVIAFVTLDDARRR
jgi:hypothetical protein